MSPRVRRLFVLSLLAASSTLTMMSSSAYAEDNGAAPQEGSLLDRQATDKLDNSADQVEADVPPSAVRWKLVGLGLGTSAVWYAGAYGIAALWPSSPGEKELRYPVVGPFIDLGKTGCPSSNSNCSTLGLVVRTVLVVIDGLGQVGGIGIALEGAFLPTAPPASILASSRPSRPSQPTLALAPSPWVMPEPGGGLLVTGRF